jgi:hypothetical protein
MKMIDPAVWIVRMFTQDETDEVFLRIVGETDHDIRPGVEGFRLFISRRF